MNPQQNPTPSQDKEQAVNVPEIPAAPAPVTPAPQSSQQLPTPPADLPDPTPAAPAPTLPGAPTAPTSANPAVAADVDIIEKEWVDKADEAVKKTEGDPHAEEEAVEDLQVDYLKKRYDHSVDKSQEG